MLQLGSKALYSAVDVQGPSAQFFCATIASRSPRAHMYASFITQLTFISNARCDKFFVFPTFCETLLCTHNLRTLSICLAPGDGDFMRTCMQRFNIIRQWTSTLSTLRMGGARATYSLLSLPVMQTLRIGGDVALIEMISFRKLTELTITTKLSYSDLDTLLNALTSSPYRMHLSYLSFRISTGFDFENILWAVSESVPNLKTLTIEQPRADIMVRSYLLSNLYSMMS